MCFMAVRLLAMHRVLKSTGSIYLHCDPTASHYLKAVMDAIFGWRNFRNEIVWCYTGPSNTLRWFPRKHDTILFYAKGKETSFNRDEIRVPYEKLNTQHAERGGGGGIGGRLTSETVSAYIARGKIPEDYWHERTDGMTPVGRSPTERRGYPTQKPLALYERMIRASSNEGDTVCDPFAGCATTLVAAERLGRQWVGMDIWERAHEVVVDRLQAETGLFGEVRYETAPPARTDDGETTAPFLRVKQRVKEPEGPRWTRAEMYAHLLEQHGARCQGCDRIFDDPRYLELDHNTPRSDGGLNHISNRVLLCGPCNRLKSNTFTLSGLRKENQKRGYMQ